MGIFIVRMRAYDEQATVFSELVEDSIEFGDSAVGWR